MHKQQEDLRHSQSRPSKTPRAVLRVKNAQPRLAKPADPGPTPGLYMERSQSRISLSASFEALAIYFPCMNSFDEDDGEVYFLCDIFGHLNTLNCELQGREKSIADLVERLCAFKTKLTIFKTDLTTKLLHFPKLRAFMTTSPGANITPVMTDFMTKLTDNFTDRFQGFSIPIEVLQFARDPFTIKPDADFCVKVKEVISCIDESLFQMELVDVHGYRGKEVEGRHPEEHGDGSGCGDAEPDSPTGQPRPELQWHVLASDAQFSDFLDGMGPAQFVGRQTLATTSMGEKRLEVTEMSSSVCTSSTNHVIMVSIFGQKTVSGPLHWKSHYISQMLCFLEKEYLCDIEIGLLEKNGGLEVERPTSRFTSWRTGIVWPRRTKSVRKSLDPLYNQALVFSESPQGKVVQVIVWGNYGRMDRKCFMGVARILLEELDLSTMVIGWYKLFPTSSMVDPTMAPLIRHSSQMSLESTIGPCCERS
ncbi:hypothetical protein F7725_017543 [Dissostichus mawsoni]|uniref:C2 domain-containing protein n=3 Tax=Percomorphaceae TaxID=1489872 RepID=A0A7J5Z5E6_DISMA|nr:hypothetical protein F7725_017543 [Dissostichus mawsoni]